MQFSSGYRTARLGGLVQHMQVIDHVDRLVAIAAIGSTFSLHDIPQSYRCTLTKYLQPEVSHILDQPFRPCQMWRVPSGTPEDRHIHTGL